MVKVDARMMTGHAGVFGGGDMVPAERTVTVAAGHSKKGGAPHRARYTEYGFPVASLWMYR